jgi:hypothetical protein
LIGIRRLVNVILIDPARPHAFRPEAAPSPDDALRHGAAMNRIVRLPLPWLAAILMVGAGSSAPAATPTIDGPVDYTKQVKPLLAGRCYSCHGALKQEGGLRLDTAAAILRGGDSGPSIVPRQADGQLIIERLTAADIDERMPPEGEGAAWKPEEVALLQNWITAGAPAPADERPEPDPREHWAFRAPERPAVPTVKNQAWVRNPIDAFVASEHERRGIRPQPPAEPGLLLRRIYIDLVGLPPTQVELQTFLADKRPDAYERVVDRLLASPQYGERWGRHWMDVWRYSDWWGLGADVRNSQKHIWHWRDWIVESLNDDLGYDEMIRQMLAGDELYPDDLDKLRATGYLVRNYFKFNRNTWLEQVVEHTSKSFLGLTLNCARCHDHKYDPFPQRDFYRMRAFFEPYQVRTDQLPGETDLERDGLPRIFDCHLDAATYRYTRGDETKPIKDEPIAPGLPQLMTAGEWTIEPVKLPRTAHEPGLRPYVAENYVKAAEAKLAAALAKKGDPESIARAAIRTAEEELASVKARAAADRAKLAGSKEEALAAAKSAAAAERSLAVARAAEALALSEQALADLKQTKPAAAAKVAAPKDDGKKVAKNDDDAKKAAETKLAEAEKKRVDAVTALKKAKEALTKTDAAYTPLAGALKAFESSTETESERRKPYPTTSTGRRTALAKLLTDRRNPLVARVAVNHIWLRHTGRPLVPTVFDFGRKGTPPTHPKLLDWLASELMEGQGSKPWSMKRLHRLIVTSNTYRMSSSTGGNATAVERDPDNAALWHATPIRIEAQVVRDGLLHLAGELDLKQGGPSIDPAASPFSNRRSLYFTHSHNEHHRFLAMFDDADVLDCYRREQSIVPQQALALANAKQSLAAAATIAAKLEKSPECKTDDGFVRTVYRAVLAYEPNADELAACREALDAWRKLPPATQGEDVAAKARVNLVHALLNHNDFVTVR